MLELGQPVAHLRGHGEVLLALVALERLVERGGGFVASAGGVQHLGEVAERVALQVQRVGALADRDGLAGERLGLGVLAAAGVDERLHLPPERLREGVLLVAELAAEPGERLGLVVAAERAERAAEQRRVGREEGALAACLEQVAEPAEVRGRVLVVAGGRRDAGRARRRPQSSPVSSRQRSPASRAIRAASSKRASMVSSQARRSSSAGCGFSGRSASSVRSASSAGRGP